MTHHPFVPTQTFQSRYPALSTGLTLVELLIALALSLLLIGGVSQLFLASKTAYQMQTAITHMQENARYAATVLAQDIRMAGYRGCGSRDTQLLWHNLLVAPAAAYTPPHGIEGWETATLDTRPGYYTSASTSPVTDASLTGWKTSLSATPTLDTGTYATAQTDIIRLWHIAGDSVAGHLQDTALHTTTAPPYATHDTILLADCTQAILVLACDINGQVTDLACAANNTLALSSQTATLQAYQFTGWLYYVSKRGRQAHNPPALYRRAISKNAAAETAQEIVEGIESLQITYGEDTDTTSPDGIANHYVTADQVIRWQAVVSVHIEILVRSTQKVLAADEPQQIHFNGATFTTHDGYLRYPFSLTVALRNRVP